MSNSSISSNSLSIDPCPFCRESIDQNGDESWYFRGDGPPPSYAVRCDSCGAQGPYGNGKFRKDHAGAQAEAVRLWNECARVALRAATGTVLATLRDLRHVAEASGRTVSLSADNILDVLAEIEGRDRRIQKLERAAEPGAWQPIETAPHMRKIVVHYLNELGKHRVVLACFYEEKSLEMHDDYEDVGTWDEDSGMSFADAGWYEEHDSDSPLMPLAGEPTHWMPLPSPPTKCEGQS